MATFNNDINITPKTTEERINEMQKVINYLADKLDKLEEQIKETKENRR